MSIRISVIAAAAAGAAVAALTLGCRLERGEYGGAPEPPPPDVRDAAAKGDFTAVVAYARTLPYETVPGSGDRQRLMLGTRCAPGAPESDCRYGPLVTIQPQRDAHRIPDTLDLARGRVVARLMTADADYPKLNVWPNDTTYWWVDRVGGRWRAVLLSSDPKRAAKVDTNAVWHPAEGQTQGVWRQSIARFAWRDTDEALWVTCLAWGCCQSDEILER